MALLPSRQVFVPFKTMRVYSPCLVVGRIHQTGLQHELAAGLREAEPHQLPTCGLQRVALVEQQLADADMLEAEAKVPSQFSRPPAQIRTCTTPYTAEPTM